MFKYVLFENLIDAETLLMKINKIFGYPRDCTLTYAAIGTDANGAYYIPLQEQYVSLLGNIETVDSIELPIIEETE